MSIQFFTFSTQYTEESNQELQAFCSQNRVTQIEKHFVEDGQNSFWTVCVTYVEQGELQKKTAVRQKGKIDYKEVLNPEDFTLYAHLRDLRKALAEQEATPVYNIFTNEQLAGMVTGRITTQAELLAMDGVGKKRVEKFGSAFINELSRLLSESPEVGGTN